MVMVDPDLPYHDSLDRVADSLVVALSEYPTEELRHVQKEAEEKGPGSWLSLLLADYLDTWRA